MGMEVGGIFGLIVLAASIWAIINVYKSRVTTGAKVLWTLLILLLPVLGLIAWFFMGPRPGGTATA